MHWQLIGRSGGGLAVEGVAVGRHGETMRELTGVVGAVGVRRGMLSGVRGGICGER